jgi:hypothetical protein
MKQKIHGWSTKLELRGEIVIVTVAAESLTEACEKLRMLDNDIDPMYVRETTTIERRDEPREMEAYQAVAVDWRTK